MPVLCVAEAVALNACAELDAAWWIMQVRALVVMPPLATSGNDHYQSDVIQQTRTTPEYELEGRMSNLIVCTKKTFTFTEVIATQHIFQVNCISTKALSQ